MKLAKNRKIADFEAAWMEAIEAEPLDAGPLFDAAAYLAANVDAKTASALLWLLLSSSREKRPQETVLMFAAKSAAICPTEPSIREEVLAAFKNVHGTNPLYETALKLSGLAERKPLDAALAQSLRILDLKPGTYVIKKGFGSPAKVGGFDLERSQILLVRGGEKIGVVPAEALELEILPPDDFRALFEFEPEKLSALSEEAPVELVKNVLRAFGTRMEFKDLKNRLAPAIIPAKKWNSWWTAAKPLLGRDTMIMMTEDKNPYLVLRKSSITFDEKYRIRLIDAKTPAALFTLALEYVAARDKSSLESAEFPAMTSARLAELVKSADAVTALAAESVRIRFEKGLGASGGRAGSAVAELVEKIPDCSAVAEKISDATILELVLDNIKSAMPGKWPDVFTGVFYGAPAAVADEIASGLISAGFADKLKSAVRETVERPLKHPVAMAWVFKNVYAGRFPEVTAELSPLEISITALETADKMERARATRPELIANAAVLRQALALKDAANLQSLAEKINDAEAAQLLNTLRTAVCLSGSFTETVLSALRRHHWEIFKENLQPWEDGYVYSTEAAIKRRQAEFQEITTVRLAENAKAIGKAAEMGDISDSMDFKTALQERDFLTERAKNMQTELEKARPVEFGMLKDGEAGVGSTVEFQFTATGEKKTLTFLGPWDADEKTVVSYRAPLGAAFMGKKVGDVFLIPSADGEKEVRILSAAPARQPN
jgi:transcription elongation GreA/GreB family factor